LVPTHDGSRIPLSQMASIQVVNGARIIGAAKKPADFGAHQHRARSGQLRERSAATSTAGGGEAAVRLLGGWGGPFENWSARDKRPSEIMTTQ